jgi:hypothetical protein
MDQNQGTLSGYKFSAAERRQIEMNSGAGYEPRVNRGEARQ